MTAELGSTMPRPIGVTAQCTAWSAAKPCRPCLVHTAAKASSCLQGDGCGMPDSGPAHAPTHPHNHTPTEHSNNPHLEPRTQ